MEGVGNGLVNYVPKPRSRPKYFVLPTNIGNSMVSACITEKSIASECLKGKKLCV